jgi:putative flippase GtrA
MSTEASDSKADASVADAEKRVDAMDWLKRFVLHVITGFAAVAVHYAVMWVLLRVGAEAVVASSVGFAFGALTRFFTAYYNVFEPTQKMRSTIPKFVLALAVQGLLNSVFLTGFMALGVALWYAQVATTVLMTFLNYVVYRLWVFK